MKKLILLFALGFCAFWTQAQQLSVSPSIVRFELEPSGTSSRVIRVVNSSAAKQSLQVSVGDWLRDTLGNHQYFKPNTLPQSCADWISVTPTFLEVQPGATAEILVNIQSPENQEIPDQMKWAMLFIQGTIEKTDPFVPEGTLATQIRENYRFGIHIYNTPPQAAEIKGELVAMTQQGPKTFRLQVRNVGAKMLNCKTYLEVLNLETGEQTNLPVESFPIFPAAERVVYHSLPDSLGPGNYSVLGILDYGDTFPLEAVEMILELN